ncbi:MAG: hypothetical protein ACRYGR_06835 [Janthinobacterium lividum]
MKIFNDLTSKSQLFFKNRDLFMLSFDKSWLLAEKILLRIKPFRLVLN